MGAGLEDGVLVGNSSDTITSLTITVTGVDSSNTIAYSLISLTAQFLDSDSDGIENALDLDSDNDGLSDLFES